MTYIITVLGSVTLSSERLRGYAMMYVCPILDFYFCILLFPVPVDYNAFTLTLLIGNI